jgi:hypothetical protein
LQLHRRHQILARGVLIKVDPPFVQERRDTNYRTTFTAFGVLGNECYPVTQLTDQNSIGSDPHAFTQRQVRRIEVEKAVLSNSFRVSFQFIVAYLDDLISVVDVAIKKPELARNKKSLQIWIKDLNTALNPSCIFIKDPDKPLLWLDILGSFFGASSDKQYKLG